MKIIKIDIEGTIYDSYIRSIKKRAVNRLKKQYNFTGYKYKGIIADKKIDKLDETGNNKIIFTTKFELYKGIEALMN